MGTKIKELPILQEDVGAIRTANELLDEFNMELKWRADGRKLLLRAERMTPEAMKNRPPRGPKPEVGDTIYIPTRMSIDHGEDDILGGLATISRVYQSVSAGRQTWFIEVSELPGIFKRGWNYESLLQDQDKYKKEYGNQKARPDPDDGSGGGYDPL